MGCNLRDLASAEDTTMDAMKGKKVGIDSFLLAFQFLTTIRDRSPTGDGGPLRADNGKVVAHLMGFYLEHHYYSQRASNPYSFLMESILGTKKARWMQEGQGTGGG